MTEDWACVETCEKLYVEEKKDGRKEYKCIEKCSGFWYKKKGDFCKRTS